MGFPDPATLVAFAWLVLLVEITPGPNMTILALIAARAGRRVGLAAVAGVALGLALVGILSGTAAGSLVAANPLAFQVVRWAGVGYLLWLAWDTWRDDRGSAGAAGISAGEGFRDGLLTNLLNPKAAAFFLAVMPAFTSAGRSYMVQSLTLVLVYVAIATLVHVAIVFAAATAHGLLADPARHRIIRRVLAILLAVVALWLLIATRR